MTKFTFSSPPPDDADLLRECEGQLRPLLDEIVQTALEAGWSKEDVLLSLVELSWNLYEKSRDGDA